MKVGWMMRSFICICCLMLLTSCWNSRELNNLGIVTGIGVDKVPNKEEYHVTFQIVNPSSTATSAGASTGQPTVTIYSSTDRTIFGAFRKTSKKAARQMFFAHTQLLVLGESTVKSGIDGIFDIFERSHELRLNTNVIVARDTEASSILKLLLPVESLPAIGIIKKSKNTARIYGESRDINVFELINGISGEGSVVISGARILGDAEEGTKKSGMEQTKVKALVTMSGLSVLKKGVLQGWLDGPLARGALWVQNEINETSINVDSDEVKDSIAVNINHSKTKIKIELRNKVPVIHVNVVEEGTLSEAQSYIELSNREVIVQLEQQVALKTKQEITQALQAAQTMKCDIFNFGNELKRINPKAWETVKDNWESVFAEAEVDVSVEAYIRSVGMRLEPKLLKGK
ncbi:MULTISPECIES: Ger(x)C family spore germination protein [Paenibacillus]|uniref:Ger(x)C family spore germination protein n=1 Tax=Paenibacillus TaxID=44249 RepID=UPI00096DA708|nr:Ger(x)C family spore germination protein [Paenibacillus odorifer]OMD83344.1 hypothetical protein BSK53_14335 [Paenibacillus odorifer]